MEVAECLRHFTGEETEVLGGKGTSVRQSETAELKEIPGGNIY